jgi:phosphoglycolate phosphatase
MDISNHILIYDFDGTLCDTSVAVRFCIRQTFVELGRPAPPMDAIDRVVAGGFALEQTFTALGIGTLVPGEMARWMGTYRQIYNGGAGLSESVLTPGCRAVLTELKSLGHFCVLLSNKGEVAIHAALEHFRLSGSFDLVVSARAGLKPKPDPESYHRAIYPAGSRTLRGRCVVIGDTIADIRYARNIAALSCWAMYGYGDAEQCADLRPDYRLGALAELPDVIRCLPPPPTSRE